MVASCQDLPARQFADILQIQFAFLEILSPAVISDKDDRILIRYQLSAVLSKLLFVIFPYPIMQLSGCLEHRLVMQMQITDRI
jgi:hypothetical protein